MPNVNQRIPFGSTVKDAITGFRGVVTGFAHYITGCAQYLVQPQIKKDETIADARWLDDDRVVVDQKSSIISLPRKENPGPDMPAPIR